MPEESLTRQFHARQHLNDQLCAEGLFILEEALKKADIKVHSISSRIKTLESFVDKARGKQLEDPISEIHDIVGIRVVCLFLSDVARIGALIRECFLVNAEDNKIEGTDASSFGYMSLHFDVSMKKEHQGPRYDSISGIPFEIQVRTIAMDAWANVSHHLDYKSDKDVPSELRKDFYALSGLFYVADTHFEIFYEKSKSSQARMEVLFEEASPEGRSEQEINLDSLTAYLNSRFPEREHAGSKVVSELVAELLKAGFKSIGEVDQLLESGSEAFARYEDSCPPSTPSKRFADVGVVRMTANIANEEYLGVYVLRNFGKSNFEGILKDQGRKYSRFKKYLK